MADMAKVKNLILVYIRKRIEFERLLNNKFALVRIRYCINKNDIIFNPGAA